MTSKIVQGNRDLCTNSICDYRFKSGMKWSHNRVFIHDAVFKPAAYRIHFMPFSNYFHVGIMNADGRPIGDIVSYRSYLFCTGIVQTLSKCYPQWRIFRMGSNKLAAGGIEEIIC